MRLLGFEARLADMRLELHPPELDLVDVVLFPISLQHLRLRGRDELGSRLGA